MNKSVEFLKETRMEMKKVTWPTREEALNYTVAIVVISAAVAFFLGGLDFLFQWVLNKFVL
jgi:preprotein translocase subunit SecE